MRGLDNYELRIKDIIYRYKYLFFYDPNIVGVGRGIKKVKGFLCNEPSVTVYVKKKLPLDSLDNERIIPKYFFGVSTDVVECGNIRMLNGKIRPAVGGISVGNSKNETGGTITYALSERKIQKNVYLLSCNHVLTRHSEEDGPPFSGKIDDEII